MYDVACLYLYGHEHIQKSHHRANQHLLSTHLLIEAFHGIAIMREEEIRVTMIYCDMLMIFRANRSVPVREGKLLLSIISTVKQKKVNTF